MTNAPTTAAPTTRLILRSLLRADFIVFLKNRRSLVISIVLPYFILVSTNSKKGYGALRWVSHHRGASDYLRHRVYVDHGVLARRGARPREGRFPTTARYTRRHVGHHDEPADDPSRIQSHHRGGGLDHRRANSPSHVVARPIRSGRLGLHTGRCGVLVHRTDDRRVGQVVRHRELNGAVSSTSALSCSDCSAKAVHSAIRGTRWPVGAPSAPS